MDVLYIQTGTPPINHVQHFKMNQFPLMLNVYVEALSNRAPPHRALTCTIIQGGMDINSPLMKVTPALSRGTNHRRR